MSDRTVSQKLLSAGVPVGVLVDIAAWKRTTHARGENFQLDDARPRILESGWVFAGVTMPDGGRQEFHLFLPGDLMDPLALDLQAFDFNPASPSVIVKVPEHVCAQAKFKDLGAAERTATRAAMRRHAVRLDCLDGPGRIAHFLLETEGRLRRATREAGPVLNWPLRQPHIGDYLSLSSAHVCRTLNKLKLAGLADVTRGFRLYDKERLRAVFDHQSRGEMQLAG